VASLRRRFLAASGLLVGLQVLGTGLGFASWGQVRHACEMQQELATEHDAVMRLAGATREAYVHEAHTLIVGGPGHLAHLAGVNADVDARLAEVQAMPLPAGASVEPVRAAIAASNTWFADEVAPRAERGELDHGTATALHEETERRAAVVEARIGDVLAVLDTAQAREREAVTAATTRAWVGVGVLTVGGAFLGVLVAGRLARAILGPVAALRSAASAFGDGRPSGPAPETGDDELGELGRAFNRMVAKVGEAELRRLEVERLAALGEMSGAVAHELMNPLAVILGDPEMRAPALAASRAEADHARRVVQGLLGFARPGEEPAERVDLGAAASAAADRVTPFAELRDVTVRYLGGDDVHTLASPSAARQVFDNLLRNAVDASAPGSTVEIEVRGGSAADGPVVEVRDQGPGIPAAVRTRLYQPFVTGRPDGTGLGLAVSKRIARAHGGDLVHHDREGGGTVAVWTLGGTHA
jgi:signal transduction histidine kinase